VTIAPGQRLGPYEITAKLGEGGMGEVYRATDTKLKRDVAIKVLPAAFTEDKERLARFEREAQLLAQLHHPSIASIFGLEESSGTRALVMELVEGPTLAERLEQAPLPLNEALAIAVQIAQALEAAHDKGIVHRDLKPQNIKASGEGSVKVLDFGLAKAMDPTAGSPSAADLARSPTLLNSPTLTAVQGTQLGVILGTAAYMAPEQARGAAVDKRADIWAFGVVLYEMLVGRTLFAADTVTDTLAGVLKSEIDFSQLPASTPPAIRRLLRRCLERNPKNRLHDIADARLVLEDTLAGREPESSAPLGAVTQAPPSWRNLWLRPLIGLALGAAGFAIVERTLLKPVKPPFPETMRVALLPPEGTLSSGPFDLSLDGRMVVFSAVGADGVGALYVRALDSLEARRLPGTEGAEVPFFSPDGRSVAFFGDKKLRRIDLAGGPPRDLAAVSDPRGGSWGSAGVIVYAPDSGGPLFRIAANGGVSTAVTQLDPARAETAHRWPQFLPDGVHFVFMSRKPTSPRLALEVGSIDSGERRKLTEADSSARYAAGTLFFQRKTTLFGQRFDLATWSLLGDPQPLAEQAWINPDTDGLVAFAVASDGRLAYRRGGIAETQLAWLTRDGRRERTVGEAGSRVNPLLSPDERRILVSGSGQGQVLENSPLVLIDDASSIETRLTSPERDASTALFSPDGSRVLFSDDRNGPFDLFELKVDEPGKDVAVLTSPHWKYPESWSSDGRFVVYTEVDPEKRGDLWVLPRTGNAKPYPFLATAAAESGARFSPDGRFLAYVSDESGREEVYVQPFPANSVKWKVSAAGGFGAAWRGDGRELFYISTAFQMMSVTVTPTASGLAFGLPQVLFRVPVRRTVGASGRDYSVSRNGQRFLVFERLGDSEASPIVMVLEAAGKAESKP
jgi:Tol biopolymer transport system component